jgi:hypothetical protein
MTEGPDTPTVTEVVARFDDRQHFETAVRGLTEAGFAATDLSVLDTHDSLASTEPPEEAWRTRLAGLTGEIKYVGPIATAGLIALAAGPVGAAVAGLVGAGVGVAAVRELLEESRATPHTDAFARALEYGAVLLWVRAETPDRQAEAQAILADAGGHDVHVHTRPAGDHD